MSKQKLGLVRDLPDEEYHKVLPPGEAFYSSSQFKTALHDIELFHKKYVSKEIVDEITSSAQNNFDIGHAYHCLTLEPHKFDEQFAVFTGSVKRGKAYEQFVADNAGKKILTQKQLATAKFIADASDANEVSVRLRENGEAEVSLFVELHGLRVKVRADWINFEDGYIMDMKSTTGNVRDIRELTKKIESLDYDLSAALYMDAFNKYLGEKGLPLINEWKFCFDSKTAGTSQVVTASEEMLAVGRKKYMIGLDKIKHHQKIGWEFPDTDVVIGPSRWTVEEFLTETEDDLL